MENKYARLLFGQMVASTGIACVINSNLGVFPVSSTNLAIANWFGVSYGVANGLVEVGMMLYAIKRGEKVGVATLLNGFVGGFIVDLFSLLLPHNGFLALLGIILLPLGYALIGGSGLGENGSCMFQTALQKQFNKSPKFIRNVMEIGFLVIGLLGARAHITWFSIILSLTFGTVMSTVYRMLKYNPTAMKHKTISLSRR